MPKTALLFPGQGSQKVGMGLDLAEAFSAARAVFDQADQALGFRVSKLCFQGPEEDLKLTENTQPAILTCSIAVLAVLRQRGQARADFVAGHSLGEYSALVAAGALDFRDAVQLVRKRGRYMQEAVPAGEGAMAALLGMAPEKVAAVIEQAAQGQVLSAANLNSPGQVVIAGATAAVERAVELAKPAGALKAVMLPVSAPFHCALMIPAQQRLAADLDAIAFRDLEIPLVNNAGAKIVRTANEAREGLKQQVPSPVRWEESIRLLAAEGVESFVEVGPGRVLTGLLRSIDRALAGQSVGDVASLEKLSQ
jgi:[acyl-carrier-protein] S-malonyltransferase